MDDNRTAIMKELVTVLLVAVLLLAAAGFAVRNVYIAVRSLDGAPAAADELTMDAVEKALREITAQLMPAPKPKAPPPAAAPQPAPPAAKGQITAVRFFAGDRLSPVQERRYADTFIHPAGNIYLEINFKNNAYNIADATIPLVIRHIDPAGRMTAEIKKTAQPKKEWASAKFATVLDAYKPGAWPSGRHTVKILFDGEEAGEYTFIIQ